MVTAAWALVACRGDREQGPNKGAALPQQGQVLASTEFYRVEAAPELCAGPPCRLTLELVALGAYKVNEQYPFRFLPSQASAAELAAPPSWQRVDGKRGAMKLSLSRADIAALDGVFKLSVCTEDTCEIAEPAISVKHPAPSASR